MTKETIKIEVEFEISYSKPEGREDAIKAALEVTIETMGAGDNGIYRARRGESKLVERMDK